MRKQLHPRACARDTCARAPGAPGRGGAGRGPSGSQPRRIVVGARLVLTEVSLMCPAESVTGTPAPGSPSCVSPVGASLPKGSRCSDLCRRRCHWSHTAHTLCLAFFAQPCVTFTWAVIVWQHSFSSIVDGFGCTDTLLRVLGGGTSVRL